MEGSGNDPPEFGVLMEGMGFGGWKPSEELAGLVGFSSLEATRPAARFDSSMWSSPVHGPSASIQACIFLFRNQEIPRFDSSELMGNRLRS